MKSRLVAAAAVSALVLLGTTGCTFMTPQSTTLQYSASDGVNITDDASPLDLRNVFIVANKDGSIGNLVAAVVNPTSDKATLTVTVAGVDPVTVTVPAGETISLGAAQKALRLAGLDTKPGSTVEVHFQAGDSTGVKSEIPVLDGSLPYYADLAPTAVKPTVSATPTPTATPAS